jgi:hypothetical protein
MAKRKSRSRRTPQKRSTPRPAPSRATKTSYGRLGHWAFIIGALIAIIGGLFTNQLEGIALFTTLFALGVVVGLLNITVKETSTFLLASVTLIIAGVVNMGLIPVVGVYVRAILSNIVVFVVPAAVIVALRTIWLLANER